MNTPNWLRMIWMNISSTRTSFSCYHGRTKCKATFIFVYCVKITSCYYSVYLDLNQVRRNEHVRFEVGVLSVYCTVIRFYVFVCVCVLSWCLVCTRYVLLSQTTIMHMRLISFRQEHLLFLSFYTFTTAVSTICLVWG